MSSEDAVEFILVSVPVEGTQRATFYQMKQYLQPANANYADLYEFEIPNFKIGTLDGLVTVSDQLAKNDLLLEAAVNKVVDLLKQLHQNNLVKVKKCLLVDDRPIESYLQKFRWNTTKYRIDKTASELLEMVSHEMSSIDNMIKSQTKQYTQVKGNLTAIERREGGNLSTKSLEGIVKKQHFVTDSEHLRTIIVAIPKTHLKDWWQQYETLTSMIVPRSSQQIAEDDDFVLMTVTLFNKVADTFMNKCRENKWTPRDFLYDEKAIQENKKAVGEARQFTKEQTTTLLQVLKTNFGELFSGWMHIKALRTFTESILRYGLPPDFQAVLIRPHKNSLKKIRDILNTLYITLSHGKDRTQTAGTNNDTSLEESGLYGGDTDVDYYPYVSFAFKWEIS